MPKFLISILCLNRLASTQACLSSVLQNSKDYDLVITDNASTDGTKEWLTEWAKDKPFVTLIWNDENKGFIPPNNLAFRIAQRRNIPYFIALNNDTKVPKDWLSYFSMAMANPKVAVAGPKGGCHSLTDDFHGTGGSNYEYCEGSCLCVKVSVIQLHWTSLFSDYLDFIYGDDSDLSLRVREKGYQIQHLNFKLEHSRGETVQTQPEVKARCHKAQEHNHEVLLKRWDYYMKSRSFQQAVILRRGFAIGDVLLVSPIIRALKQMNPNLTVIVKTDFPKVFENNPLVFNGATHKLPIVDIDLNGSYEGMTKTHIVEAYESKVREYFPGLPKVELKPEFFPSVPDERWAEQKRKEFGEKVAVIHVGLTDWVGKNWYPDRWEELATWLVESGWHVVAVGSGSLPGGIKHCVDLTRKTSLSQMAALMKRCQLFVGIDSAPMHFAQSQGIPTVGLFGVTRARYIMTNGSPHAFVECPESVTGAGARHLETGKTKVDCGPEIMNEITVDAVKAAIERIISK